MSEARPPHSLFAALLPIVTMLVLFTAGMLFLGTSAELLIAVLLVAAAVAGGIAIRLGHTWNDIQRATGEKTAAVMPALLILLAIGMLISTWVLSGTIPFLVYWGVRLVDPQYLLVTAFLTTALMSTCTGTSWGSAGTIGVALMGTAVALDAPLAATAGAIISGAYFGDKMSPLSDTTNICAIAADTPLYTHIRHMLYTAVPSFILALVVYGVVAALTIAPDGDLPDSARVLLADLDAVYNLSWLVLLPPAVVVYCVIRRVPPALAITLSALVAALLGLLLQGFSVLDAVVAAVAGFSGDMLASVGVDPGTVSPDFLRLVERGGLYSMATTLVVVITAFVLAAGLEVSGALALIIARMLDAVRSISGLVAATMGAGATMIALTSHGGVTALIVGGLFQQAYRDRGLAPENLSRSLEDSVTVVDPLMPWTVSGVFMATTLGVPTLHYLPWAIFCYGGPIGSLLLAHFFTRTGFGLRRLASDVPSPAAAVPVAVRTAPE